MKPPIARSGHRRSRGIALIVVLAILAIALALVYAISRSSVTLSKLSVNEGASLQARCAAEVAAAFPLQDFAADPNWMPDSNPTTGTLPTGETYELDVQPINGGRDRSVTATAQVIDPQEQRTRAKHVLTVKLARQPRDNFPIAAITACATQASDDADLVTNPTTSAPTVYTTGNATVYVANGTTIRGNIRSKGPIYFQKGFTLDGKAYVLGDIATVRTDSAGYQNYRACWGGKYQAETLNGFSKQTNSGPLSLQTNSGPLFLSDVKLGPSSHNPMGVFYHDCDVVLGDNVTILGTIVCKGNLSISGSRVKLFALQEATDPETDTAHKTSFPAVVAAGSITFLPTADVVRISGLVLAAGSVTRKSNPTPTPPGGGHGNGIANGTGLAIGLAGRGNSTDTHDHTRTIDAVPDPFETPDGPAIYIKGAIMANGVYLENQPARPFALVFDAATTDTTDAPGFFTWKLREWTEGN